MDEVYISQWDALQCFEDWEDARGNLYYAYEDRTYQAIEKLPPADVKEVIHGTWEWDENGMDLGLGAWKCSECKAVPQTWWNTVRVNPLRCGGSRFCGDCGADMRKIFDSDS